MSKDLFSKQAASYATYRPSYPSALVDYILSFTQDRYVAWDAATGNGQLASLLAPYFDKVIGTDISEKQLSLAIQKPNIQYRKLAAESTDFRDNFFDLVTVAQAFHWFDADQFQREVTRVGKPGSIIALIGYNLLSLNDEKLDAFMNDFYSLTVGPYWDPERKILEKKYESLPFNFHNIERREFTVAVDYSRQDFAGYLRSWSAVQHYIEAHQVDPVAPFVDSLNNYWKAGELKQIGFPLFVLVGRIIK